MQKKIIALAVAGLVSGVAFAQTNVTVYGAIDVAYVNKSDAIRGDKINSGIGGHFANTGAYSDNAYNAIDTNGYDASWFGLKGTEDLGNGLTASFQAEMGILPDNQNAATQQRSTFVQLEGKNWGSIKAGNYFIDTVLFNTKGGFDNYGMSEKAIRIGANTWANNAIRYATPSWGGLQASVGYSSNFTFGQDDQQTQEGNNRTWFGDVTYRNGPLFVGATYSNFGKGGDSKTDGHEWNIGAAYDFKVVNVGLVYDSIRFNSMGFDWINTNSFIGDTDLDRDTWRLNVGVPITAKDSVYMSYANVHSKYHADGDSDKFSQNAFGVGYKHNLSKRTSVYAQAYFVDADDLAFMNFKQQSGETLQNGYQVGMRHTF